jgi:hypothetical protein
MRDGSDILRVDGKLPSKSLRFGDHLLRQREGFLHAVFAQPHERLFAQHMRPMPKG